MWRRSYCRCWSRLASGGGPGGRAESNETAHPTGVASVAEKRSTDIRKRIKPATRWGVYLVSALLLAVLGATGIAAQLLGASATPEPSVSVPVPTASPAANVAGASNPAGASSITRTLYVYGDQLRPLAEETNGVQTLNIYGPGGQIIAQVVQDGQGNEEVRYLLADHLGSTRVVLDADGNVVARFEYGPHGETTAAGTAAAEVRYRYTGHPYDQAQGVYETPARGYDPTLGRFLSVDPQRHDASPYVYAGNNPINQVDPTGSVPVYFYLYSEYGMMMQDQSGARSKLANILQIKEAAKVSGLPYMVMGSLESTNKVELPAKHTMKHLTLDVHGNNEMVAVLDPKTNTVVSKNGEEFAQLLYDRLESGVAGASKDLESILLTSCRGSCDTRTSLGASRQANNSFADRFASAARKLFPELKDVIATPYDMAVGTYDGGLSTIELQVSTRDNEHMLNVLVDAGKFFSGDLPPGLFDPPTAGSVEGVWSRVPHEAAAFGTSQLKRVEGFEQANAIILDHGFTEPIFSHILESIPEPPPALATTD